MKIHQLVNEAATASDIVQMTAPFAASINKDQGSNRGDDLAAKKFAWKFKVLAKCVDRHGPSGGWPEYTFWGPRENMVKFARAYSAGAELTPEEEIADLKKSKLKYEAVDPVMEHGNQVEAAIKAAQAVKKEITGPRGSDIREMHVEEDTVSFVVGYDFPEHRVKVADLRPMLKDIKAKISMQSVGRFRGEFAYEYVITFAHEFEDKESKKIKAALK